MRASRAWLSVSLLLFSLSARAEEPGLPVPEAFAPTLHLLVSSPIRPDRDRPFDARSAIGDRQRLRIRKGAGLEYRRLVNLGEREVVLGVKGPVMKKRLGVAFEVRF